MPEQGAPDRHPVTVLPFERIWPLLFGLLTGLGLRLVFSGGMGEPFATMMGSFVVLAPLLVGAVTVYAAERQQPRRSWRYCFRAGALANLFVVLGTLVIAVEGLICAVLFVPLCMLLGGVGGLAMGAACRWAQRPRRALYGLAALPLLLGGFEQQLPLPDRVSELRATRLVLATPEVIWAQLNDTRAIAPREIEDGWMYRIGVPLPLSGVTTLDAHGRHVRQVAMGKNVRFEQVAVEWEASRRVRWAYRFTADSFPPGALDDHVRIGGDHFDILDTEYVLTPRRDGATELAITMRYRVSTRFNWYAEPIAALLIGNFEDVVLRLYARRAEAAAAAVATPSIAAPTASATSIPSTPALMMPPA